MFFGVVGGHGSGLGFIFNKAVLAGRDHEAGRVSRCDVLNCVASSAEVKVRFISHSKRETSVSKEIPYDNTTYGYANAGMCRNGYGVYYALVFNKVVIPRC